MGHSERLSMIPLYRLQKAKLSKLVVTKTSLLSIYNKEYERLKEAFNQLQQKLSEKDNVEADTGKLVERQPGDGMEMGLDATESGVKFYYLIKII